MSTIFLSHGSAESSIAEAFQRELAQMKMSVYLFEHDRKLGQDIASKLQFEIERADIVLALLTKTSQYAPYVHQEIGYAQKAGKPIVLLVELGTDARILGMLAGKEYIPFDYTHPEEALSATQTFVHNHEMEKYKELVTLAVLLVLALGLGLGLAYVYTTWEQQNEENTANRIRNEYGCTR